MRGLIIGPDFALGQSREGNADTLRLIGAYMNFSVTVIPPVKNGGEVVSSTAIREALANGDIKKAIRLMGRFFSLRGRITTGAGRGSELGFPTANLEIGSRQAIPVDGVYATMAYIDDKAYQALTNIGKNPTFGDNKRTVETYIIDYRGDLYGHEIKINFVEWLRDEKRFDTVEELKKQMAEDVKQGKAILESQVRK